MVTPMVEAAVCVHMMHHCIILLYYLSLLTLSCLFAATVFVADHCVKIIKIIFCIISFVLFLCDEPAAELHYLK